MLKVVQFILIYIIKMSLASSSEKNKCFQNCRCLQNFSEALAVQKMAGKRGIKLLQQIIIIIAAIKTILTFTFVH